MQKLSITAFCVISAFCNLLYAQSGWQWLNPSPTGVHLNFVRFINSNTGFIVGDGGTILRSSNTGLNWTRIQTNITNTLLSVSFSNETNGIAVGEGGIFLKTTNSGLNWYQCYDSISYYGFTNSVFYVDNETVYAGEIYENLMKSTNGGINWVSIPNSSSSSIFFLNSQTGYKAQPSNEGGYIEITTNGGENWSAQLAPDLGYTTPNFIRFTNSNLGLITSYGGVIYYTSTGGQIWYNRSLWPSSIFTPFSAQMLDENTGYAASDTGKIYKTTNSGINWIIQRTGTQYHLMSLDFINANTGVAVGNYGAIVRTTNGGLSWSVLSGVFSANLKSVNFANPSTGFIAGLNNIVLKTTNGGANWIELFTGYFINYFCVKFIDVNTGFLAGDAGTILRTTNCGLTWLQCNSSPTFWLVDIDFWDNQNGYAVGSNQTILKTTNGGINWSIVYYTTNSSQNLKIDCVSQNIAYVSGSYIYKTTNAGVNWNVVSPATTSNMRFWDLSFLNDNTGYAASADVGAGYSNILKTTNGGINWVTQYPGNYDYNVYQFMSVAMLNVNTGYTCGDRGYIYKTTNGGSNWNLILKCRGPYYLYNPSLLFNRIYAYDTANMYIIGEKGSILKKGADESTGIIVQNNIIPKSHNLKQNYPNPFNARTVISFQLPAVSDAMLKVYDVTGKEVATLVNERLQPGTYEVTFDGSGLNSGVYFYRLIAGNYKETKKMLMLK